MKREVVLDTETTGLDPNSGHRIVEIGCVEVVGGIRTGAFFHCYLNPEREVPDEAFRVHGLSTSFLRDKPIFSEKVDEFMEFIAGDPLVIHNAGFELSVAVVPETQVSNTIFLFAIEQTKGRGFFYSVHQHLPECFPNCGK